MGKTAATTSGTIKQVPFPSTVCFRLLGKVDQRTNVGLSADAKLKPRTREKSAFLGENPTAPAALCGVALWTLLADAGSGPYSLICRTPLGVYFGEVVRHAVGWHTVLRAEIHESL